MITGTPFEQRWVLQGRLCGAWAADLAHIGRKREALDEKGDGWWTSTNLIAADDKEDDLLLQEYKNNEMRAKNKSAGTDENEISGALDALRLHGRLLGVSHIAGVKRVFDPVIERENPWLP